MSHQFQFWAIHEILIVTSQGNGQPDVQIYGLFALISVRSEEGV